MDVTIAEDDVAHARQQAAGGPGAAPAPAGAARGIGHASSGAMQSPQQAQQQQQEQQQQQQQQQQQGTGGDQLPIADLPAARAVPVAQAEKDAPPLAQPKDGSMPAPASTPTPAAPTAAGIPPPMVIARSGLGAFLAIGGLTLLHHLGTNGHEYTLLLGSFGATVILLFGAPAAPLSQPRNVVGGHLISAFAGVSAFQLCNNVIDVPLLAGPLGVSAALMAMQATKTVHPPAGGTALIAVLGPGNIHAMGYVLLAPTFFGSVSLVATAVVYYAIFCNPKVKYPVAGYL